MGRWGRGGVGTSHVVWRPYPTLSGHILTPLGCPTPFWIPYPWMPYPPRIPYPLPHYWHVATDIWWSSVETCSNSVADPGFPRGGGANSPGGRQHMILPNFSKTAWNWKNLGPQGGGARPLRPPLDPPLKLVHLRPYPPLPGLTSNGGHRSGKYAS